MTGARVPAKAKVAIMKEVTEIRVALRTRAATLDLEVLAASTEAREAPVLTGTAATMAVAAASTSRARAATGVKIKTMASRAIVTSAGKALPAIKAVSREAISLRAMATRTRASR